MRVLPATVMSGLPASGKTNLGLPCLDKDDLLERLYDSEGVGAWKQRRLLSRNSDLTCQQSAEALDAVVLVSHWRPHGGPDDTGTPTSRLNETYDTIVEDHRACSPEAAAQRFLSRHRHPGHLDADSGTHGTARRMRKLAQG